eukprot:scaffold519_cov215-Prasinococcus_capsulatus_cf.AAC.1
MKKVCGPTGGPSSGGTTTFADCPSVMARSALSTPGISELLPARHSRASAASAPNGSAPRGRREGRAPSSERAGSASEWRTGTAPPRRPPGSARPRRARRTESPRCPAPGTASRRRTPRTPGTLRPRADERSGDQDRGCVGARLGPRDGTPIWAPPPPVHRPTLADEDGKVRGGVVALLHALGAQVVEHHLARRRVGQLAHRHHAQR